MSEQLNRIEKTLTTITNSLEQYEIMLSTLIKMQATTNSKQEEIQQDLKEMKTELKQDILNIRKDVEYSHQKKFSF